MNVQKVIQRIANMKVPLITLVFVCIFIQVNAGKFVANCNKGAIATGEELYQRFSHILPTVTNNIVSECNKIFTNIVKKHKTILEQHKITKMRHIVKNYLEECMHVTVGRSQCVSTVMYQIDKRNKCRYKRYEGGLFANVVQQEGFTRIVNYRNLSTMKGGPLESLMRVVATLLSGLLTTVTNLLTTLLGDALSLRWLIDAVMDVASTLVVGIYNSQERIFIKDISAQYMGNVVCLVDDRLMPENCLKLNICLDRYVKSFENETVNQIYKCLHMKFLHLAELSADEIMNVI